MIRPTEDTMTETSRRRVTGASQRARPAADASESQRDRIRLASVRLFAQHGYAGTSMKRLASELGTVPANLYNYYPNKEAILFDVLSDQLQRLLDRDQKIVASCPGPAECMRGLAHDLVLEDLRNPLAAFVGQQGVSGLTKSRRQQVSAMMSDVRELWMRTVKQGVAAGIFVAPDPKLSALTILTLCSSTSAWFKPSREYTPEEVASYTATCVLRILGCPGELNSPASSVRGMLLLRRKHGREQREALPRGCARLGRALPGKPGSTRDRRTGPRVSRARGWRRDAVPARDRPGSRQTTRMADHWWHRPGWALGTRFYTFHFTFTDQPGVQEHAAKARARLEGLPGLDLVPGRWLHLTTQGIGFADKVSDGDLAAIASAARRHLATVAPVPVSVGAPVVAPEGIVCWVGPDGALNPARDAIRAAIADVWGSDHVPEGPDWAPHMSVAYSNATATRAAR
ncbi:MAG: TetR family transcriptional regulator, partial [Nocardiopsaceae bacterium]|nr:TetR family transcriptional regulator [Nocardiopsaceae bacterium]